MSDNEGANQANAVAGGMAAAMMGTLSVFDSQAQTWEEYCEVLGHFFEANNITDAGRKRAILLSSVGSKTYSLMRNLLSPDKPGDKSFTELTNLLQSHFNPKPSEIVQRFKFNSRTRTANETVTEYVAVLRELAQHCNYGDKLKEMLRDRLVCGIAEDRIQRRLLAEPDLTFEKALKIAQAIETANRDVRDLQPTLDSAAGKNATPMTVHKVGTENKRQRHVKKMCRSAPPGAQQTKGGGKSFVKGEKVPVLKPDGGARICGDYKLTVNPVSKLEQYPIPRLEDLFEKLTGGEKFSKLDLSHAYQQVSLDETSKPPAIFQRMMEGLLSRIPNVAVYLDDILLTGRSDHEHLETLNEVLRRLQEAGLRLKRNKCAFLEREAEFLGHKVDSAGLHPLPNKTGKSDLLASCHGHSRQPNQTTHNWTRKDWQ
uniref:ribonuclease H n=1 Tax=Knipowitschia caucasica TaxID=637954 RepID=A0AAV2IUS0_KNICA